MKKTLISILAGAALALSFNANAVEDQTSFNSPTGDIVHAGVNAVIGVGDVVVSLGQNALTRFPGSAMETAKNLAKCIHDGLKDASKKGTPIFCPITIGTEAAVAMVIAGAKGVHQVVAVPAKFAKEVFHILTNPTKENFARLEQLKHNHLFWLLNVGVCVLHKVVKGGIKIGKTVIEMVKTHLPHVMELVVNGVKTGIKYAHDAIVMVTDCVSKHVVFFAKEAYGMGKGVLVAVHDVLKGGKIGGKDGAVHKFIDNVLVRVVTLPTRAVKRKTMDDIIADARH